MNPISPARDDYDVKLYGSNELTPADLQACFTIIADGAAVNTASMERDLPHASTIVVARSNDEIVGVGVIKPIRKKYAADIAVKSGFAFPKETPELGYVAVHSMHRRRGLSLRITQLLLTQHSGRIFATTDDAGMKKTLQRAGFSMKGKEWCGNRGNLSFWERV